MGSSGYARSFRELIVSQKGRQVSRRVFEVSQGFPREETYSLTGQVRLDKGLDEASAKGWTVVDMKREWKRVFHFQP
jgi:hypothetical protein